MAEYSSPSDVKDVLLRGVSKPEDHDEAEKEVNKELRRRGIDPTAVADGDILKELSVAYACMIRCIRELKSQGDGFDVKRKIYEYQYKKWLDRVTQDEVDEAVASGGDYFSIPLDRG